VAAQGATIDVTFELVTPAYAGGADPHVIDCLRPPTLKALLRFWWRTMHAKLQGDDLFRAEERLFGSTRAGQGIRMVPRGDWGSMRTETPKRLSPQQRYLGYGRVRDEDTGRCLPRLPAGSSCDLRLVPPPGADEQARRELHGALWLLSAFGGIGGRSRRGWGSLRVAGDFPDDLPDPHSGQRALAAGLKTILKGRLTSKMPRHTAFSANTFVAVHRKDCSTWEQALDAAGRELLRYCQLLGSGTRSSGKGPDNRWRRFWFDRFIEEEQEAVPQGKRQLSGVHYLGLPRNAYYTDEDKTDEDRTLLVGVGPELKGRRASPLFISIVRDQARFRPVFLSLPAHFLPSDDDQYEPHVGLSESPQIEALEPPDDRAVTAFFRGNAGVRWQGLLQGERWSGEQLSGW